MTRVDPAPARACRGAPGQKYIVVDPSGLVEGERREGVLASGRDAITTPGPPTGYRMSFAVDFPQVQWSWVH